MASRGFGHPLIVGHDRFKIVADRQCRGEVDGIERSEDLRFKDAGRIEDSVIDPDEVHTSEGFAGHRQGLRPQETNRAQGFHAEQGR